MFSAVVVCFEAHMAAKDYYDTVGVNKNATASEIKKAYYGLGHETFEASASGGGGGPDAGHWRNPFQDLGDIFGFGPFARNFTGKDVKVALELSLMEVVQGCTKKVVFQTELTCETCGGSSVPPETKPETCGVNVASFL